MYEITINHNDGAKSYPVLTQTEADEQNIEYSHWKEALEGEYLLTDDGYVSQVIKRSEYEGQRKTPTYYIRAPFGYIMHNPAYSGQKFYAEGRSTPWTLTGKPQLEVKSKSDRWRNLALAFVANNFNADVAIEMVFGSVTPSQRRRWKRNIRTEEFRTMMREELDALLNDSGKDREYTMQLLQEAIDMAKDKKDVTNLMRAAEKLMDLHGMNEKDKVRTTHQIEGVETRRLINDVIEEERKLIASEVVDE